MKRVALVTYTKEPDLSPDDRLLAAALRERGVAGEAVVWDRADVRWEGRDAVVVRSCWDYHHRPERFRAWVDALALAGVPLWNPASLLRWNIDKIYLAHMQRRGVAVVPTEWVDPGSGARLADILAARGWRSAVVKPAISATAFNTWRAAAPVSADDERRFRAMAAGGRVLVQPFLREVAEAGEWSLIFFAGAFSHAVLKRPKMGDFRVQAEFGGRVVAAAPSPRLVEQAAQALAGVDAPVLYARVDGVVVGGAFLLMELELIEPSLFLGMADGAAARFADAVCALIE